MQRQRIRVRGAVQGVGFRPFVYRLAHELGIQGWVCNDAQGVLIEAQGTEPALQALQERLQLEAPPLARVEAVQVLATEAAQVQDTDFRILASRGGPVRTSVPPDTAPCADCLDELFDPNDRRHRYAFTNCTQCGPRYTITRQLPYDRPQTSMAPFALCPACTLEYTAPLDRRFHAEPNACPVCGPRLRLCSADGMERPGDPLEQALAAIEAGEIVAVQGLGGFQLVCDARRAETVARLRARKHREEKPFAVMVAGLACAQRWVRLNEAEAAWLRSPERPIVLLPLRRGTAAALSGVAPGLAQLGVMLPASPLQYLLFHEAAGRPAGRDWLEQPQDLVLVATSANPGGEPLVIDPDEALQRLQGIADRWLLHDRAIVARCDDSVLRLDNTGAPQFIRRARGWTPRPIPLARSGPSVLATGGWLKNTVCLTRGDEAFLSPHIGDLDNAATCRALAGAVAHLCRVLDVQPAAVAHDQHPDFFSTRFALQWAADHRLPSLAVQHHHAHIAAVAAEHRLLTPCLGLALDGVGLGPDGSAWGGELLRVDGAHLQRLGHLAPLALPGADAAAREPWRMAAAVLHRLGRGNEIVTRHPGQRAAATVQQMLATGLRCPPTTSMGRWFDAAAALLAVRETAAFEGQAPMLLEALAAAAASPDRAPPDDEAQLAALVPVRADGVLDPLPLLAALADTEPTAAARARAALRFHQALAIGLAHWVEAAARRTGLRTVALGGGCFLNALLCALLIPRLQQHGLHVLQAQQAPPNDGGIALGQAWVLSHHLHSGDLEPCA